MHRDDFIILVTGFQREIKCQLSILEIWDNIIDNFKVYGLSKVIFISNGLDWFSENNFKSRNIISLFYKVLNRLNSLNIDIYVCKTEADKRNIIYDNNKLIYKGLIELWSFIITSRIFVC